MCSAVRIWGSATLMIVTSRTAMNCAVLATAWTAPRGSRDP